MEHPRLWTADVPRRFEELSLRRERAARPRHGRTSVTTPDALAGDGRPPRDRRTRISPLETRTPFRGAGVRLHRAHGRDQSIPLSVQLASADTTSRADR